MRGHAGINIHIDIVMCCAVALIGHVNWPCGLSVILWWMQPHSCKHHHHYYLLTHCFLFFDSRRTECLSIPKLCSPQLVVSCIICVFASHAGCAESALKGWDPSWSSVVNAHDSCGYRLESASTPGLEEASLPMGHTAACCAISRPLRSWFPLCANLTQLANQDVIA